MSSELYGLVQSKITTDDIQAFKAQAKKMKVEQYLMIFLLMKKKEKFLS